MTEHPGDTSPDLRVIEPTTKRSPAIWVLLAVITAAGGLLTLLNLARGVDTLIRSRSVGYGATMFVIGSLGLLFLWLWSRNVRLLIGQGRVGYRDFFSRNRIWWKGEIDHVVDTTISYGKTSAPQRGIYFLGSDGKRILALNPRAWSPDDLKDFVEATGVRLDVRDNPVTAKDARREFPNAFGWGSQHVMIATSLTMVAAVGLVIGGYALVSALFAH